MKKFNFKSLVGGIIVGTILTISTIVNANTTYSVGITGSSSSKLNAGESVTVNMSLSSVNAGSGIDAIEADLVYDNTVFEPLTASSVVANNGWIVSYEPTTNRITMIKTSKVTAPESLCTINLKVKSGITAETAQVKLSNIVVSGGRVVDGGTGDIYVNNAIVTLSAKGSTSEEEPSEQPEGTPTTPSISGTSSTSSTSGTSTTKKDSTIITSKVLPKTGAEQYVGIAIVSIAIIGIACYALYKKTSKEVK